ASRPKARPGCGCPASRTACRTPCWCAAWRAGRSRRGRCGSGVFQGWGETGSPGGKKAPPPDPAPAKTMPGFPLPAAAIPTPPTWVAESPGMAGAIVASETKTGPLVLKPLFGSQGRGLRLIASSDELPAPAEVAGGVYYLQRFAATERDGFRDFRLLVSGG